MNSAPKEQNIPKVPGPLPYKGPHNGPKSPLVR